MDDDYGDARSSLRIWSGGLQHVHIFFVMLEEQAFQELCFDQAYLMEIWVPHLEVVGSQCHEKVR